ncbi:MAG: ATP-binding protein [Bacteroidales bacterium]|nr:ATP-binding protein [Bacteroidales bacterium]
MKTNLDNPFIVSGYKSPEYFCDRNKETAELSMRLENGNNVTLISPRRMGKTGLIHHVFNKLKKENPSSLFVYVDLMPTGCLSDFAKVFSVALMENLDSTPVKILKKATSLLSRVRPTLSFDPVTGDPKISVDIAPGEESSTVEQLLSYIGDCGKTCYIAFDEFQQIAHYPEKNVEAILRSKIQFLLDAHFIFAGSNQHLLSEMFISYKRPFYASTSFMNIGAIAQDLYYPFASGFFVEQGRNLREDAFSSLYDRFEGHTWYIQKVLNRLYSLPGDEIDSHAVLKAVHDLLSENEYYYQSLMRAYSRGQGKLMKAIAKEGRVTEILSGAFISKYDLNATSSVRGALKRLVDDEIVYRDSRGYAIYDRLMAEWLRDQIV